jgi:hypothetical protein
MIVNAAPRFATILCLLNVSIHHVRGQKMKVRTVGLEAVKVAISTQQNSTIMFRTYIGNANWAC